MSLSHDLMGFHLLGDPRQFGPGMVNRPSLTPRQADQKWVDDTRAEYLRRANGEAK